MPTNGSVSISKGFYNNGTHKIITQGLTASLADLKQNQTVGCKNDLYMTTASGTAVPYITSLAAPTGTFDATVKLDTPVYLDWTKEYIAGGAEIAPEWSFVNSDLAPNYTVIGSPTIDSDYILSSLDSSSGLVANSTLLNGEFNTFEVDAKITTGSSISSNQIFFADTHSITCSIALNIVSSRFCLYLSSNGSSWDIAMDARGSHTISTSTTYYVKLTFDGSKYVMSYSTDDETFTDTITINSSTKVASLTPTIGAWIKNGESPDGSSYFYGSMDLKDCCVKVNGTEVWRAVSSIPTSVSTTKALSYDSGSDKTYWYPQETAVTLADVKASQTVSMKNHLYCTNTTGSPTASITFCEGTPSGVTEYYQQPKYVWLNSSKDKILGIQEESDEIVLETVTETVANYTVVGSPTISSEFIGSDWSGGNYLTIPTTIDSTDNTWEVCINFTLTSSTPQHIFGVTNDNNAIIMSAEYGVIRMYLSSGSGWDIAGAVGDYSYSLNTHYYVKLQFTGTNYILSVSTDGVSWTESANVSSSTKIASGKTLYLGSCWDRNSQYLRGSIDLKDCYIKKNGTEVWRAVSEGTITKVKASEDHYWTYLNDSTYNCKGRSINISSMTGTALSGYLLATPAGTLIYTGSNHQGLLGDAFLGYTVTFTDTSHSAIASLTKTGTRCRCYSAYNGNVENPQYYFFYVTSLPVTGEIPMTTSGAIGEKEITPSSSTSSYTYDAATDTITYSGYTASYIGDVYVNLGG